MAVTAGDAPLLYKVPSSVTQVVPARPACALQPLVWSLQKHAAHAVQANKQQYPSHAKLLGLLRAVQEELPDAPLYYTLSGLCRSVKASSPKMDVLRHAIVNAGYRASNTHCNSEGVKTDAPPEVCAKHRYVCGVINTPQLRASHADVRSQMSGSA